MPPPSHLELAVQLCIFLSLATHGGSSALSPDMGAWNLVPGFYNKTRIWDRPTLDAALTHRGSLFQVQQLVKKLQAGEPIVAGGGGGKEWGGGWGH